MIQKFEDSKDGPGRRTTYWRATKYIHAKNFHEVVLGKFGKGD